MTETICLGERRVEYRLRPSKGAKRLRVKIGPDGVSVVLPNDRREDEVGPFLIAHQGWVLDQLARVDSLSSLRRERAREEGTILFKGRTVRVVVTERPGYRGQARLRLEGDVLTIARDSNSSVSVERTVEHWMRRQAREAVAGLVSSIAPKVNRKPKGVYLRGQRTKWGSCSARGNVSINWRLIMAPEFVLRYMVTHEVVHLAVPDHSRRFWLTVQSLCHETERARQWLSANGEDLLSAFSGPAYTP